ncbi:MAG: GatB/YqeY domain-containing protein [candidate division KSB1 bacterium]|nr:GatB/YqeY domain-containing protein [candidate division KSB1 bacterium]MDZ7379018.1 GatB/YqeY domain-containing protein [candidate division KSB1 bacterium]MDZ7393676.1 GatB/YqeY domain-containing protein [candidate division KSB1 bacterium]
MNLQQQLMEDMKAAMKAGQKERLAAIRMVRAQLKDAEIAKGGALSPEEELKVLSAAVKKRKESITAFEAAGRHDLVAREKEQLAAIESYLPQQLSSQEIERELDAIIAQVGAVSAKDLGKVMAEAMKRLRGRADGKVVQELARRRLG